MKTFIKEQQELAEKLFNDTVDNEDTHDIDDNMGYRMKEYTNTLITQIITNTGAEIMRRVEGERRDQNAPKPNDPHFTGCGGCGGQYPTICGCRGVNQALDTIKQHIKCVTE
jgi:hypothetical protein